MKITISQKTQTVIEIGFPDQSDEIVTKTSPKKPFSFFNQRAFNAVILRRNFVHFFGEERLPFDGACNDFAVIVPDPPVHEVPPPDYDHVEPCDDDDNKPVVHRLFQNRRLKNCITVHLPPDNPQLFAVELREHCDREYLIACLAALKHLLEDKDD
jgi:hypothetical protein